jgi:hypothetical protein
MGTRPKTLAVLAGLVVAVLLTVYLLGRASTRGKVDRLEADMAGVSEQLTESRRDVDQAQAEFGRVNQELVRARSTVRNQAGVIQGQTAEIRALEKQKVKTVTETVVESTGVPESLVEDAKTCITGLVELSVSSPDEETAILDRVEAECNRVLQA